MNDKQELRKLDYQLKKMQSEVNGTVDKNYGKYNTVFMDKVAKHNEVLKRVNSNQSNRYIKDQVDGSVKEGLAQKTSFHIK